MCSIKDKPKKKPKHTNLVLPGDKAPEPQKREKHRSADRLNRVARAETPQTAPATGPVSLDGDVTAPGPGKGKPVFSPQAAPVRAKPPLKKPKPWKLGGRKPASPAAQPQNLPDNVVVMPRKNPRLEAVRRKKRNRRILSLVTVLLMLGGLFLYFSGLYLYVVMAVRNSSDFLRIRLTPGDGWPAPYSITGYIASAEMGGGGFASLGDKDMAIYSASGKELRRVQHGYANPGIAAGNTRVCVYNRGGSGYVVEGRGDTLLRRTTEQDLLFTKMSANGTLAVVTSSRYRATLQIFGPVYQVDPDFSWSLVDEKPVTGDFHTDNKQFALACLSARDGALGTTVYLLKTDKEEPQATIRADAAWALQVEYISQNRLLVVYDTFAALYTTKGDEVARYDYGGKSLLAAHSSGGSSALVFGSLFRDSFELVFLNDRMQPLFEQNVDGTGSPRVLSASGGVYLLYGQDVIAFTLDGQPTEAVVFEAKPLDLVQASEPLVLTVTSAEPLKGLLRGLGAPPQTVAPSAGTPAEPSASAASPPPVSSLPAEGQPPGETPPPG